MAFTLNSISKIGRYSFRGGINDLVIKKNVHVIIDTAVLKIPGLGQVIPINSAINDALNVIGLGSQQVVKNTPANSVETAKLFKEGDPVAFDLGYNGDLRNEFRGFVRRVNLTTPVTIEMEGYAWQLRNQNILASWKKTTLKEVLTRIIQGTDIVLSPDIPTITLTSFYIKNESGLKVLEYLKDKMLLTVYFDDNVLYAGIEEGRNTADIAGNKSLTGLAEVVYNLGYNCPVDQPDLKQRLGSDNKVRVRLKTRGKTGKHVLYEAGDPGGAIVERIIPFSDDKQYLQDQAAAYLKKLKYDGYEGTISGLLQPFCKPGWKAAIMDKRFAGARAGTYFVAGTEVRFGVNGAERKAQITYRLDG
ncbi:hypothetical protein J3L18_29720 [Mucilaginibacter gossypii]|uniref:hypothetical protein n=1 Tax=Mucilaginibacter gossypii TaxID=551996 RepID=UPI000DCE745B|nr:MULTISPECIES: hypothetical protein [Mucilaginibacter]QTE37237.1 hypothetical protein J3L18_29720 [Mucilaginibacter gossypii]RAV57198.1 hypothetical protein DIU36_12800 [Mucilaginibacter rubeus]